MNQLPVETSQELLAQSNNKAAPPPAPVKAEKLHHDRPEVDQDETQQDTKRPGNEGGCSGNQLRFDGISDEPMVKYDGFESIGKPCRPHFGDNEDEDVVSIRSPIICKVSGGRSTTLSPTCVSALGREKDDEPSWTIQEFQEYLGMLELLQDVCSSSGGDGMCLSAASLSQMERLLTSLLPQGV